MTKPATGELPPQPNEQPQPRRRNIYDCDGEYEFPTVQHIYIMPIDRDPARTSFSSRDSCATSVSRLAAEE